MEKEWFGKNDKDIYIHEVTKIKQTKKKAGRQIQFHPVHRV